MLFRTHHCAAWLPRPPHARRRARHPVLPRGQVQLQQHEDRHPDLHPEPAGQPPADRVPSARLCLCESSHSHTSI